jgi:hypothetical protein
VPKKKSVERFVVVVSVLVVLGTLFAAFVRLFGRSERRKKGVVRSLFRR